jgi:general secretion pathway protein G
MKTNRNKRRSRRGFTLLEVMIVVAIIVMLAAFAIPNLLGMQDSAKIKAAKVQVQAFNSAVESYKAMQGDFPSGDQGLNMLVTGPGQGDWKPLMANEDVNMPDPWGQKYNYMFPGSKNKYGSSHPDIWSSGPDRQSGTADDIGNWRGTQ